MSLGNTSLHQRGEIPEIVKLPNGRLRVIRRFTKFTREDVDNANLGSTMGDFGDLDTTGEQVANQGYSDCRLISVEVDTRFNAVSNADNAVLVKTYETLTSEFVQITDDTVTFTENGLKQITRVYRAISGTTSSNTVGTTTLGTGEILASSRIEDNDAFAELTETYIEAGTLSRTEDFVGSQDSLVIEAIGPDPSTPSGFSLASKQESNFEGFQTNRFTFLRNNVQLSQTEDKVGSQLAISQQWFKPDADKTLADYSLASKNTSDFSGIETVEYRFLKDNVVLSRTTDLVGSQNSITVEVFNPNETPNPVSSFFYLQPDGTYLYLQPDDVSVYLQPDGDLVHLLAAVQESNVDGIPTKRYTFLKPSILSVQQEFNETRDRITVRAFNKTSAEVDTALNEVTSNHKLIAKSEDDFQGIKTSTYVYELDSHDVISTEENGLRTLTRSLILAAGTDYDEVVGTDTITHRIDPTDAAVTLYLSGFSIRDTSEFRVITEEYIEAGILSINREYASEGVCRVTTTFLVTEGTVVGPIIGRAIGEHDGLKTIAVTHMQQSDGTSLIDNSNPAVSHKMLENFTYPGTVRLDNESLNSTSGLYSFSATDYALESPVNAKVPAVMEIHFRTTDSISYPTGYPLWNPTEWAYGESKGIAWDYFPFSISRAFRGYRTTTSGAYNNNDFQSVGTGPNNFQMISGRRIFSGTRFHIYAEGGPENPVANKYTLDYKVSEAFQDLSGAKYYKHVIIRTDGTIPQQ